MPRANFVRHSPDDIARARELSTTEVISRRTGWTFKRAGREWLCEQHDSLRVFPDDRGWRYNSQDVGGATCIDWLTKIEGLSFRDAVSELLGGTARSEYTPAQAEEQAVKELELPPKNSGGYARVTAYLTQTRCIAPEIVSYCIKNNLIYEDEKHNVVFCGLDDDGNVKYASKRGTYTYLKEGQKAYRGECTGSDKSYGFLMPGTVKEHVYVFEAPIDALSHATLNNIKSKHLGHADHKSAYLRHTRLALGGTCDNALLSYMLRHPEVTEVSLCLDGDEAGRTATTKIADKLTALGVKVNCYDVPRGLGKDYNEFLQNYVKQSKQRTTQRSR